VLSFISEKKTHEEHGLIGYKTKTKQTPWPSARKRTVPTERPPLVGEI
jgi:hypothetical protein